MDLHNIHISTNSPKKIHMISFILGNSSIESFISLDLHTPQEFLFSYPPPPPTQGRARQRIHGEIDHGGSLDLGPVEAESRVGARVKYSNLGGGVKRRNF